MKTTFVACLVLAMALSLPHQAQPQSDKKSGDQVDKKRDAVLRPEPAKPPGAAAGRKGTLGLGVVTCTLTFSPASITNNQTSHYTVAYSGACVNGQIAETVTLHWASTVSDFGELTVRTKMLNIPSGCLGSSGELVAGPTALGINGTTTAQVEVRDWTGTNLICTASGTLTVQ